MGRGALDYTTSQPSVRYTIVKLAVYNVYVNVIYQVAHQINYDILLKDFILILSITCDSINVSKF